MLNVRANIEDRKSLMGHETNSEMYSHYHSAISSVHVQELFRDIRVIEHPAMHGLSLNRRQQLPQTISPEGWEKVQQDPELIQYGLETSQLSTALCEVYGSTGAAARSCDPRVPDLLAASFRLTNRRRVLLRRVYQEEYRKHFTERAQAQVLALPTSTTTVDSYSESGHMPVDDIVACDAHDWVERLEQDEESAQELGDYQTIMAEDSWSHEIGIGASDSSLVATGEITNTPLNSRTIVPFHLSEGSDTIRLHRINDGSARPKNMTIARVREAMSSGGLTDVVLSQIMVEVFSATHQPGKYIPGEEPVLGTSICRFSGIDLSSDTHSPETVHRAHFMVLQKAANALFDNHLLPLDTPCTYQSQGPTKKKNPKLCGFNKIKTRAQQIQHVFTHTLKGNKQDQEVGNIPHGEWHCYYDGCAVLTTSPSTKKGMVSKVLLSTTSIFLSKRSYLRHVYQEHHLSPLSIESVLWCGICEHFLAWDQFGAGTDEHFEMHWDEVWKLVADHGYTGQYDNGRRTIPSFCPFCLHNEDLSLSERISTAMNFYGRTYPKHIAMHFDGLDSHSIHSCPCSPQTCSYQGKMTPMELRDHLSSVHGIERVEVSRAESYKNSKVLSKKSENVQGGMEEERLIKKARK
jgi:hypothetical protein